MADKIKENIRGIVESLLTGYSDHPVSSAQFKCRMPNKTAVIEITDSVLELIYPGYLGEYSPNAETLRYYVGDIILRIEQKLANQIFFALSQQYCVANSCVCDSDDCDNSAEIKRRAEEMCLQFFRRLPLLREHASCDVQAALDGDPAASDKDQIISCYPGVFAVSVYRIAHELLGLGAPYIPRIMTEYAHSKTGIDIHPGAEIGKYFFIDHGTGVVVGETTTIGDNVRIYQGVTLGALSLRGGQSLAGTKRHPTIQDGVTIYSGATVLGGETVIGKNVVVGGNAFVTESIFKGL